MILLIMMFYVPLKSIEESAKKVAIDSFRYISSNERRITLKKSFDFIASRSFLALYE